MNIFKISLLLVAALIAHGQDPAPATEQQRAHDSAQSNHSIVSTKASIATVTPNSPSNTCSSEDQDKAGSCVPDVNGHNNLPSNHSGESQNVSEIDLLLKEITELETQIALNWQKIELLGKIRSYYTKNNMTIPEMGDNFFRRLEAGSPSTKRSAGESAFKVPTAGQLSSESVGPYPPRSISDIHRAEANLMNKIIKKSSFFTDGIAHEITFFPTKTPTSVSKSSGEESIPPYLMATVVNHTTIEIYDLQGVKILNISVGRSILRLTANKEADEMFIVCLTDDLHIHLYSIATTQILLPEPEDPEANNTKSKKKPVRRYRTELTSKFEYSKSLKETIGSETILGNSSSISPSDPEYYTFLTSATVRPQKYLLLGTHSGDILIYFKNGSFGARVTVGDTPIISIHKMFPNLLYATKNKLGFLNPQTLENDRYICENAGDDIVDAVADMYGSTVFYALLRSGEILVYELKANTKTCKVASKRNALIGALSRNISFGRLHNVKNYALYQEEPDQHYLQAFNISDITAPDFEALSGVKMNLGGLGDKLTGTTFSTFRNGPISSLIASAGESPDGRSKISIHEITVPRTGMDDWFANYRLAFVVFSVLLVLGYQFWYKRRKSGGEEEKEFNKYERPGKSKSGGTSSSYKPTASTTTTTAATTTSSRTNFASNLSEQTRSLEDKLSTMDRRLESLGSTLGGSKGRAKNDDDDDYGTQEISYKKYD